LILKFKWIEKAARAGKRFGFVDLLIVALVAENGCSLWSANVVFGLVACLGRVVIHRPSDCCRGAERAARLAGFARMQHPLALLPVTMMLLAQASRSWPNFYAFR
jgi:hypothetical protein